MGGVRISDPAADLAIAIAVASAAAEQAFGPPLVALGEVGLSGEVRRVAGLDRRLAEASRLGVGLALAPPGAPLRVGGLRVIEVESVEQALASLQLRYRPKSGRPQQVAS